MDERSAKGVAMRSEEVTVELHDGFAIVDATFVMANPKAARSLEVGFPGAGVKVESGFYVHRPLVGFQAWVDGQPVAAKRKEVSRTYKIGPPGYERTRVHTESWHVFQAAFAAKKDTLLRVRYGVLADLYTGSSYSSAEAFPDATVWYILATGRLWEGPIGEAVVKIVPKGGVKPETLRVRDGSMEPPDRHAEPPPPLMPAYGQREGDGVTLRRAKLEPTQADNVQIIYRPDPARWPKSMGEWWQTGYAEAARRLREAMGAKEDEPVGHP
jgi:hypothetical protein